MKTRKQAVEAAREPSWIGGWCAQRVQENKAMKDMIVVLESEGVTVDMRFVPRPHPRWCVVLTDAKGVTGSAENADLMAAMNAALPAFRRARTAALAKEAVA